MAKRLKGSSSNRIVSQFTSRRATLSKAPPRLRRLPILFRRSARTRPVVIQPSVAGKLLNERFTAPFAGCNGRARSAKPFPLTVVSYPQPLLMRRLHLLSTLQLLHEQFETIGKAVDIEVQRIIMPIPDVRVDGGMKRRNEPAARSHACDRVE